MSDEAGVTGYHLIEGPYVSPTAEAYDFQEACFAAVVPTHRSSRADLVASISDRVRPLRPRKGHTTC